MTSKASGRSALLAIGLLLGLASASQAGTDNVWPQVASPQALTTDTSNAPATQGAASDQLNDADRTLAPATQPSQTAATAQPDSQMQSVQAQSVVPAVARSDENSSLGASTMISKIGSGSDTRTLIGKIFIGFGTLLTLGSSAARMLMG